MSVAAAEKARTVPDDLALAVFTLGEIGYVVEDRYVLITDRVSDMIVSGGVNIYPAEAEQVLIDHPEVADVAVIGVPDEPLGEAVKALDAFCRERLAGFKCPRSYDVVDDLGRNVMG